MKKTKSSFIKSLYVFLIFMFLYTPIMVLMVYSFNESKLNVVWTGFTFKWYQSLMNNAGILEAAKNSFQVAIASTLISVVIGTLTAIGLYRYKFRGKNVLDTILNIPLIIPEIVMGISLLAFFSMVQLPLGKLSLIAAHVTFSIAYKGILPCNSANDYARSYCRRLPCIYIIPG
ncbi:MAG: binding-protein-dependent transport system inner rane component [Clostridia bacterium]|nr:binding-protein-dependent transport system inner rane component [Clostridia bacterium]